MSYYYYYYFMFIRFNVFNVTIKSSTLSWVIVYFTYRETLKHFILTVTIIIAIIIIIITGIILKLIGIFMLHYFNRMVNSISFMMVVNSFEIMINGFNDRVDRGIANDWLGLFEDLQLVIIAF